MSRRSLARWWRVLRVGPKSKPKLKLVSKEVSGAVAADSSVTASVANSSGLKPASASAVDWVASSDVAESRLRGILLRRARSAASLPAKPGPSMARASSMRRRKLARAASARCGKKLLFGGASDGVPGADAGGEGDALERLHGGLADAARGRVDHAGERDGVVRIVTSFM